MTGRYICKVILSLSAELITSNSFFMPGITMEKIKPYLPMIILFVIAFFAGLLTFKDYGISWDEPSQRMLGTITYDYITHGKTDLLAYPFRFYGSGFEVPLMFLERTFNLTDTRDIYLMRHLVTHLVFLLSALSVYFLLLRMFRNNFIASMGFFMLAFAPRIYAHSYFNTKDIPFLCFFTITLCFAQYAFSKNKMLLFLALGLVCGYTTSVRVMGIMLMGFIAACAVLDIIMAARDKQDVKKPLLNICLFVFGFCIALYAAWPYLWRSPIHNFVESYKVMSHYNWDASVFIGGKFEKATHLPWTYFPTWFFITTPVLWLIAGFVGVGFIIRDFIKQPLLFLRNTNERNFLVYIGCFLVPILAVIFLHAVIYDDWRHLYFVFPSFALIGIYAINKLYNTKFQKIVMGVCILQAASIGFFMFKYHPFQQVYFNELVSHDEEYLRRHYEMDYWGSSYMNGLQHLAEGGQKIIKICPDHKAPVENNLLMLPAEDRSRFQIVDFANAEYYITNFRMHPEDYPSNNIEYSETVLNSTIMRIYRLKSSAPVIPH